MNVTVENQITGEEVKVEGKLTANISPEQEAEIRKFLANGGRIMGAQQVSGAQLLLEMQPSVMSLSIGHALTAPGTLFNPFRCNMRHRQPGRRLRPEDIKFSNA